MIVNLYNVMLEELIRINKVLVTSTFIKDCFVFGSLSKFCISDDSDIDLIIIGTKEKTIETSSEVSKLLDSNSSVEIDAKYYNCNEFKRLIDTDPLLLNVEKDCVRLEELINELPRFCK